MTLTSEVLDGAVAATAAAAERAGVTITDLREVEQHRGASALFDVVWGRTAPAMPVEVIRALQHSGSQVTGAYDGDRMVGATVAFLGRDGAGGATLHSHITGVLEPGRGIGLALKRHQRAWALQRGITTVTWTFDPLIRRNAYFNLARLGAEVLGFLEDFYGAMSDDRNRGQPTDRVEVAWDLTSPRTVQAATGRVAEPRVDALRATGAEVAVDVASDGRPVTHESDADRVLVRLPEDIEGLRASDPAAASAWRAALRAQLAPRLASGARVAGCTRDGWLLVTRGEMRELQT